MRAWWLIAALLVGLIPEKSWGQLNSGDLLVNASFDSNNFDGWSGDTGKANFVGSVNANSGTPEVYNAAFDIYQTISVPNGVYRVSAQAKTNTDNKLYVYASTPYGKTSITKETVVNNATSDLGIKENLNLSNISATFKSNLNDNRFTTDNIAVTDGKITVGIKWPTYVKNSWAVFDAFRLTLVEDASSLDVLKNDYNNLCEKLKKLLDNAAGYPTALIDYAKTEANVPAGGNETAVWNGIEHINKIMALFNDNAKKVAALQTELKGWLVGQPDEDLQGALTTADTDMASDAANMETIYNNLIKAQKTYAGKYSKQYVVERFDLNDGKLDGWANIGKDHPTFRDYVAECWNRNVDIYRGLTDMPSGHYRLTVNAFIGQGGQTSEQYDEKLLSSNFVIFGDNSATGSFYRYSVPVLWRYDEVPVVDGVTMGEEEPSNPAQANAAFGSGYYVNTLDFYFDGNGSLNYGIAGTNNKSNSTWLCFDNFELTYMGNNLSALWDDMQDAAATRAAKVSDAYKAVFQSMDKPAEVTEADIKALSDRSKKIMEVANKVAEVGNQLNDNSVIPSSLTAISTAKYDDVTALNNAYTEAHNKRKSSVTSIAEAEAIYPTYVTARQEYMKAANPTGMNTFDMDFLLTNPSTYAWGENAFTKNGSDGNGYYSDMICKIGQKDYVHNFGLKKNSNKKGSVTPEVWEFVESWTNMPGGFKQKDGNGWVIYQQTALPEGAYKFKAATFGKTANAHIAVGQGNNATDKGDAVTSDGLAWTEVNFSTSATTEENPTKLGIFIEEGNACDWFGIQYLHLDKVAAADVNLDERNESWVLEEGSTPYDITLTRTLKAGKWNTFCVPFNMDEDQLSTNKITEVRKLTSAKEGNVLTFDKVSTVEAGVPYIVKVSEGVGTITVNNTTIKAAAPSAIEVNYDVAEVSTGNKVAMTGNYTKQYVPKDAYFISNNMFYLADEADAVTLKGFRAYITATEGTAVGTEANCFFIDIDGVVTAASEVLADKEALQDVVDVYTMTGVKVRSNVQRADALNGLAKGLYIVGGKTVINNE